MNHLAAHRLFIALLFTASCGGPSESTPGLAYPTVGTQQDRCYGTNGSTFECGTSSDLAGQDGDYAGLVATYEVPGDGTVRDLVTGLTWQASISVSTFDDAPDDCASADTGGYGDWRVPSIRELYSLMDFRGQTGTGTLEGGVPDDAVPYLDASVFEFLYGDEVDLGAGGRFIDAQYLTSTAYVHTVMNGQAAFFGVNFADGRIKGYPQRDASGRGWFLRCVRGAAYGTNDFEDLSDGTIVDHATGLMWTQQDSGALHPDGTLDWPGALAFCEDLELGGHDDWRLPDAKALHSLVDYGRAPDTTASAAIDPIFESTGVLDEAGDEDFGFYWSSTTHLDGPVPGTDAVYVAFGRALGFFMSEYMDVHGAGAQRGDPKVGEDRVGCGEGPQGDCRRVYNLARCVRSE